MYALFLALALTHDAPKPFVSQTYMFIPAGQNHPLVPGWERISHVEPGDRGLMVRKMGRIIRKWER
jgi:hypothetical protein